MKTLHLTLKKKWFDMILSGEKKEEYREFKPFWITRFIEVNAPEETKGENKYAPLNIAYDVLNGHKVDEVLKAYYSKYKEFEVVQFTNGYGNKAPTIIIECKGISNKTGNYDWGYSQGYFVISLGNILETRNCAAIVIQ